MPRKYKIEQERKNKERKLIDESRERIPVTDEVTCMSCKKPSGWANDVLMYVTGDRELKCKNCGEVCVRVLAKKSSGEIIADNRTVIVKK